MPEASRTAGRFRDIITVQRDISVDTNPEPDFGGPAYLENWRCDYIDAAGLATFRGSQVSEQVKAIFEIREDPARKVDATMRVIHGGGTLFIESVKREQHTGEPPRTFLYCRGNV